jgi:sucrose-6-phosphatase
MKFLLVTDLDNTLIGEHESTIALNQLLSPIRDRLHLIYATGRSFNSYQQLYKDFHLSAGQSLLEPDYLVTGVGSEIYERDRRDPVWASTLSQGWDRSAIALLVESMPELVLQSPDGQNQWKLSYCANSQNNKLVVEQLKQRLQGAGLSAQVIFSSDRDVDILPSASGKGKAVDYLRTQLDIPKARTLVCGDSGNDITMFEQRTLGVVVNNAQSELLEWHRLNFDPNHYLARSTYAEGIIEAINYFKLM